MGQRIQLPEIIATRPAVDLVGTIARPRGPHPAPLEAGPLLTACGWSFPSVVCGAYSLADTVPSGNELGPIEGRPGIPTLLKYRRSEICGFETGRTAFRPMVDFTLHSLLRFVL